MRKSCDRNKMRIAIGFSSSILRDLGIFLYCKGDYERRILIKTIENEYTLLVKASNPCLKLRGKIK